jgi:hypothetical protein
MPGVLEESCMKPKKLASLSMVLSGLFLILGLAGCDGVSDPVSDVPRTLDEFEEALRGAKGGARSDEPVDIAFAGGETAWNIYFILGKAGKYVNLDLSESSVTGFDNADYHSGSGMIISLILPNNLTVIGSGAFKNWDSLTGVIIPPTVSRIEAEAFRGCSGLVRIIIPAGVTGIGADAFSSCGSLTVVTFAGTSTGIADDSVFPSGAKLRTAAGASGTGPYTPNSGTYNRSDETWWRT